MLNNNTNRVVLGMSGGVDSAVAARLLVEDGYEVIGVTLKLWEPEGEVTNLRWQERTCCKVGLARYAASELKIEHRYVDVQAAFKSEVIDPFCAEYLSGRTPNPCINCNEKIKFSLLAKVAKDENASFIATGHYARLQKNSDGKFFIHKAHDSKKDQSYFLYKLPQTMLPFLLFPLGEMKKSEIWKLSESIGLPPDEVKESQEICFVTQKDYRGFLKEADATTPKGNFIDTSGKIIGEHTGISNYTVGQRRGLNISVGERLYVITISPSTNQITLGKKEDLLVSRLHAEQINMFNSPLGEVEVKVRYSSQPLAATAEIIEIEGKKVLNIVFKMAVPGVTPGQSVVLYKGEQLVGGGVISETFTDYL